MTAVAGVSIISRVLAVIVLVAMAPLGHVAAACVGWSGSAAQRMACCRSAGDGCTAVSADGCCAHGQTRRNLETVSATLPSPDLTDFELVLPAARPARTLRVALRPLSERPDTYLLDSVFLI